MGNNEELKRRLLEKQLAYYERDPAVPYVQMASHAGTGILSALMARKAQERQLKAQAEMAKGEARASGYKKQSDNIASNMNLLSQIMLRR